MKKYVILFIFCLSYSVGSCQEEDITLKIDKFSEVKVFDGLSINLIRSSVNKVVIKGESVSKVVVINNKGVLKLRMQIGKVFSGYKTFIDLYYADDIMVIDVNEDARIYAQQVIKQDVLELKAQEGGELIVAAEVEQMLIKSVTGGVIRTSGFCDLQDVVTNTGGVYEGGDFKTNFTTVNVNAGSLAEVHGEKYVKAGGEVRVYGNPSELDEKTVFGGIIKRM